MVKVPPVCDDDTVEAPPLLWASLVSLADWPSGSVTGNWGSVSYPKSASVRSASTSGSRLKIVIPRQSARKLHIVKAKAWLIACTKKKTMIQLLGIIFTIEYGKFDMVFP